MQQEGKHIALFWEDHIPVFLRPFPSLEKNHLICLGVCGFSVKEHFSLVTQGPETLVGPPAFRSLVQVSCE